MYVEITYIIETHDDSPNSAWQTWSCDYGSRVTAEMAAFKAGRDFQRCIPAGVVTALTVTR